MGVKRPFDEETIQELSFKQVKQLDEDNKSIPIPNEASGKDVVPGYVEDMEPKAEFGEDLLDDRADWNLQTSAALPSVTNSSAEEEAGSDGTYYLPLYPDFVDFNVPRRPPLLNEDAYSYLLNTAPRKLVPVGLDHQADIPEWNSSTNWNESLCSYDTIANDHELNVAGTSIIGMPNPNFSFTEDANIGSGRSYCTCLDKDSIQCVNQHVQEAREKLRESLGEEKFAGLGFRNMGEEVANSWTEEEEYVFHKVVYSNPVSLGKDFWKSLSAVFPSRTNMELVSYYFNVFILRRRAVQNRSDFLDIDSDDDECQEDSRHSEVEGRDDDSVVESFGYEDLHIDSEIGVYLDNNNDDDDDGNDDNGGNNEGDVGIDGQNDTMNDINNDDDDDGNDNDGGNNEDDVGTDGQNDTMNDINNDDDDDGNDNDGGNNEGDVGIDGQNDTMNGYQEEQVPPKPIEKLEEDSEFINQVNSMAKVLSSNNNAQDGIYIERNSVSLIHKSGGELTPMRETGIKVEHIKFLGGKTKGTNESLGAGFILDGCDTKAWDYAFSTSRLKSIDLLPTCNMIEEIFGPCAWND